MPFFSAVSPVVKAGTVRLPTCSTVRCRMMDMPSSIFLARNRVTNGDQCDDSVMTATLQVQIYQVLYSGSHKFEWFDLKNVRHREP